MLTVILASQPSGSLALRTVPPPGSLSWSSLGTSDLFLIVSSDSAFREWPAVPPQAHVLTLAASSFTCVLRVWAPIPLEPLLPFLSLGRPCRKATSPGDSFAHPIDRESDCTRLCSPDYRSWELGGNTVKATAWKQRASPKDDGWVALLAW